MIRNALWRPYSLGFGDLMDCIFFEVQKLVDYGNKRRSAMEKLCAVGRIPTCEGKAKRRLEIMFRRPEKHTRWWFQIFLFSPLPEEMIQFDEYFSNGLKPPTRENIVSCSSSSLRFSDPNIIEKLSPSEVHGRSHTVGGSPKNWGNLGVTKHFQVLKMEKLSPI